MVNNAQKTELVLVSHNRPIAIPSKIAGIGPIPNTDTRHQCSPNINIVYQNLKLLLANICFAYLVLYKLACMYKYSQTHAPHKPRSHIVITMHGIPLMNV